MSNANENSADLNEQLKKTGLPEKVLAILQLQPDPTANEMVLRNLSEKGKYVAIEKQNFSWFLTTCRLVGELALTAAFLPWAPGAIADLIILLIEFRAKSIDLTAEEGAVVFELKNSGGLQVPELAKVLGFDEKKVQSLLTALANDKTRHDKVPVKLVVCDSRGVWTAPNV
jgi:hypothetical protein